MRRTLRALLIGLAAGLAGAGLTLAAPAAGQTPWVTATPALTPAFSPSVSDYVTRCQPANQVALTLAPPLGTSLSVDGGPPQSSATTMTLALSAGQEFTVTANTGGATSTYYVRCLPSDFPAFSATSTGGEQAQFYVVAPNLYPATGVSWQYVAVFDTDGVPVWWMKSAGKTIPAEAALLANGDIVWTHSFGYGTPGAEEHALTGSLVRSLNTVGTGADHHDIQLLPNGNYLMGTTFTRTGVNMSSCGGSTTGTLKDFALQELTPSGALVWSWTASAHIPVSEVAPHFSITCRTGGDIYHWNSVALDGSDYLLSFRNLYAVYAINATTGAIDYKLGGTHRAESLAVLGDPYAATDPLCAQHDARVLPDGTITVYDDATGCNRHPRAVRYAIDTTARTATLLSSLTNSSAPFSWCCGSARLLPGGNWVIGWGGTTLVTEETAAGASLFTLKFTQGQSSYRAEPVLPGAVTVAALRAGMDAQYPGG